MGGAATGGGGAAPAPEDYAFDSRFEPGKSPVSYSGQSHRQLLIGELKADIGVLTAEIDGNEYSPDTAQKVIDRLNFYYETVSSEDCATLDIEHANKMVAGEFKGWLAEDLLQTKHGDISCSNLKKKMAGNDTKTDHKDWSTEFVR